MRSTEVLRPFRPLMEERGFRFVRQVYLLPLTEEAVGFVGYNHGRRGYAPDAASLFPAIGVRYESVEALLVRAGFPASTTTPTIVKPLRSLMSAPADLVVSVSDPESYQHVVDLVQMYALPFLGEHLTLESGRQAARDGLGHYLEFSLPALDFLVGDTDRAVRSLEELAAGVEGQSGVWPDHVRKISGNLISLMR